MSIRFIQNKPQARNKFNFNQIKKVGDCLAIPLKQLGGASKVSIDHAQSSVTVSLADYRKRNNVKGTFSVMRAKDRETILVLRTS